MTKALVWIRRDLRLKDHAPLAHAASKAQEIALVFVFDPALLRKLEPSDRRLSFIHASLENLQAKLAEQGSSLVVKIGDPKEIIPSLAKGLGCSLVCTGKDYEPFAKARDAAVAKSLKSLGIEFLALKDQVIFEEKEILTQGGGVFKVFTPYKNTWLAKLSPRDWEERTPQKIKWMSKKSLEPHLTRWDLKTVGFQSQNLWLEAGEESALARLKNFSPKMKSYGEARNFPVQEGTSGLSVHLRFGTISIRECVRAALKQKSQGSEIWLSELIWRDFYHMILDQNPHVVGHAFKKEYDSILWPGSEKHFQAWCAGETGYPIIDAAMRHFNATGWMHNRLRMVVASFLTKDLLVDWRKGEEYFAKHLLDFDLAANNGGWQWSASTGCDAQPYFRIFNPYSQSEKFDADGSFIRSVLPELAKLKGKDIHCPEAGGLFGPKYPAPIVDHSIQREKALALFKK